MKKTFAFLFASIAFHIYASGQVTTLDRIGQTPGGAGYHVNWDSAGHKLIVGCGTSVWVYDMTDVENPVILAKRPLIGLINETDIYGNVLFVAATHYGVLALDYTSPELDVLAHYDMREMGDTAAYDLWRSNDTLYVADNKQVRMLTFSPSIGFTKVGSFGPENSFCVSRRGDYIAVGGQGVLYITPDTILVKGNIHVYHRNNLATPAAVWQSERIGVIQDIQFADLRDDIIYVCAGPEDLLFTKSNFFALQFTGDSLYPVDTHRMAGGILMFAQLNIMNMDSRNDTLFVVTTAATKPGVFPLAYMPILDATGLPADTMKEIAHVVPGLWHFDAALMDGTPYIAMSSEWCGVLVSDVSQLQPMDTVELMNTGGWCVNSKVRGNTLWACHEGNGLWAYNIDSLLYANGNNTHAKLMHIFDLDSHFFSSDVEFLNDSLMMINTSVVYNISGWLSGGQPQPVYDMNRNWVSRMSNIGTNLGQRMVATNDNLIGGTWVELFNPFDSLNNFPVLATDSMRSFAGGMAVSGDTVYYGKVHGGLRYLCAQKVMNDAFVFLDTIPLVMTWGILSTHDIYGISCENGIIAVAYGKQFAWFRWNGNQLEQIAMNFNANQRAMDVVLKNNYLYIADKFYGMKIYDISSLTNAVLKAECRGTGGWKNVFGSTSISVADDGRIFLSDFHAGVIIIEAYDTTLVSAHQHLREKDDFVVFPNPSSDGTLYFRYDSPRPGTATIEIRNLTGNRVSLTEHFNIQTGAIDYRIHCGPLSSGLYFVTLHANGQRMSRPVVIR